jgi:hypothetical protein
MLRDSDHHSPKSCNQFYFLWYTSQELCLIYFFSLFSLPTQSKPNRRLCFLFLFSLFSQANAEQTKPSSLFLFLFSLFSLPMRSKPNWRLCFFFFFRFFQNVVFAFSIGLNKTSFLANFLGDSKDDLR